MDNLFSPPSDKEIEQREEARGKELMKKHKTDNLDLAWVMEKWPDNCAEAMRRMTAFRQSLHN